MERETRVAWGPVPHSLLGTPLAETRWHMKGDEFLLRGEREHYFHYRRGEGITIERAEDCDTSEETLWLNGSVYAAIASMNGLRPIHASAVAVEGAVYAFSGPAGAGKSTLIAALGRLGFPMFCDDTLILDLSGSGAIIALPGHKRLKLSADAIDLSGARQEEQVSRTVDKFYATSAAGNVEHALPLAELIFLEDGPVPAVIPISGAERIARMQDDHYTSQLFDAAQQFDLNGKFQHLCRLAERVQMSRFVRPCNRERFDEMIGLAADHVRARAKR
jgi:hypothetical protein